MKIDILSFYNAYDVLKAYQRKYDDVMNKLRNIALASDTKYSVLIAVKENRIQTTPDDKAYPFEVEAYYLRKIIEISMHVLEKQMKFFKNSFYPRYAAEIMKLRKNIIAKNVKFNQIWEKMNNLIEI